MSQPTAPSAPSSPSPSSSPPAGPRVAVIGLPGAWSTEALADAFAARTGFRRVIGMEDVTLDLATGEARHLDLDLRALDGLVVKKITEVYTPDALDRLDLLAYLATRGLRVFSPPQRMLQLVNRLSGTLLLRAADIPMPATVITERLDDAARAVRRFGAAVLKPLYTSKARGMRVIEDGPGLDDALAAFRDEGNTVLYIQQRVDLGHGRDLGLTFIGETYVGCYARVRAKGSWTTSTAAGGRYEHCEPGPAIVALARRARDAAGLDFTCVDVVETPDGPQVFEVSAFGGFRGLKEAAGLDAAGLYADHVLGRLAARGSAR